LSDLAEGVVRKEASDLLTLRLANKGFGTALFVLLACLSVSWSEEKHRYRDIYLTEDRVCKACRWELLAQGQVRLTNRQGVSSIVAAREIIGVDQHPWGRRLFLKGLYGTGLAGKVIVPYAFEDGQDFVCKYCD
jgi:hypothetical protein